MSSASLRALALLWLVLGAAGGADACDFTFECAGFNPCKIGTCINHECVYTDKVCPDDGNLCTVERCDDIFNCVADPYCAQDGVTCNGPETCILFPINLTPPFRYIPLCVNDDLDCSDFNECTQDFCAEPTGCEHTPISCDDGNVCTTDTCGTVFGCVHTPVPGCCRSPADCGGDLCVQNRFCVDDTCTDGSPVSCNDGNACTDDGCDPASGCVNAVVPGCCNADAECDGDRCAASFTCIDHACASGPPPACADDDACTDDACDPNLGCIAAAKVGFGALACICARDLPAACGGQTVPKKLARRMAAACKAIARAEGAEGKKLAKLVGKAAGQIGKARRQADKGTAGVTESCAHGLAQLYADAQARADGFRAGL